MLALGTGAVAVILFGWQIKTKTNFDEFASSIVALGFLLAFSCVYFAGSVYQLIGAGSTMMAYLLVAGLIHGLVFRLRFDGLSPFGIIGVCLLPILNPDVDFNANTYLLAVWVVALSSLIIAVKKQQMWMVCSIWIAIVVSFELLIDRQLPFSYVLMFELFYGLFFVSTIIIAMTKALSHSSLVIYSVGAVASFLVVLVQLYPLVGSDSLLPMLINASVALIVGCYLYRLNKLTGEVLVVLGSVWVVGASLVYLTQDYWGLFWALEGLALMGLAKRSASVVISVKGQLLVFVGLIYCLAAIAPYYPNPALNDASGLTLAFCSVVICSLWLRLHVVEKEKEQEKRKQNKNGDRYQQKVKRILSIVEVVLATLLFVGLVEAWVGPYSGVLVPVLQLGVLLRAKRLNEQLLEYVGFALMIMTGTLVCLAGIEAGSFYFVDLPWSARLTVMSLLLQLWLVAGFYRRFHTNGALAHIAQMCRSQAYLLSPVIWLPGAFRTLGENVVMVLWLSPLLTLFVYRRFANVEQKTFGLCDYVKVIVGLSSLALVMLMFSASAIAALIGLIGFAIVYWLFLATEKKVLNQSKYGTLFTHCTSIGYFIWGLAVCGYVYTLSDSPLSSLLFAGVYWGIGFFDSQLLKVFARNYQMILLTNVTVYALSWFGSLFERQYSLVPLMGLGLTVLFSYCNRGTGLQLFCKERGVNCKLKLFLHIFIAISYCCFLVNLLADDWSIWVAPSLVVHGVIMLFLLDRQSIHLKASFFIMGLGVVKLVLIDASTAMMSYKVGLFMGLGGFVLLVSWLYQRMLTDEYSKGSLV